MTDQYLALSGELTQTQILMKASLCETFGRIWNRSTIATMLRALEKKDEHLLIRQYAALALSRIGDHRAALPLAKLMLTDDATLQVIGAEAVGRVYHASASATLVKVFAKRDSFLTHSALKGLLRIGKPAARALIDGKMAEDPEVRAACQAVWEKLALKPHEFIELGIIPPEDEGDIELKPAAPLPPSVIQTVPEDALAKYREMVDKAREEIRREDAGREG